MSTERAAESVIPAPSTSSRTPFVKGINSTSTDAQRVIPFSDSLEETESFLKQHRAYAPVEIQVYDPLTGEQVSSICDTSPVGRFRLCE